MSKRTTKPLSPAAQKQAQAFADFAASEHFPLIIGWLSQQSYNGLCPFMAAEHNQCRAAQIAGKQQLFAAFSNEIKIAQAAVKEANDSHNKP